MSTSMSRESLRIFSTCPPSNAASPQTCHQQIQDIARWSEDAGCEGILVYTNNALVDPWLASQAIIAATLRLCPLVAVQPVYMHPYSAAKMIATLGFLYQRRVHLNMLAGGFTTDLAALNDDTPHDERYDKLVEYTHIIQALLRGETLSFEGRYYRVNRLKMSPPLPAALMPEIFVSGSSEAGMAAGRKLRAIAVEYPRPADEYPLATAADAGGRGIRIGIIARDSEGEAWSVARQRFPEDRKGQLTHEFAMKVSDSSWHKQLAGMDDAATGEHPHPYWLLPFKNYKTFCPYLVGSYGRVAEEVARYVDAGYRTFILDVPESPEEMRHIGKVFRRLEKAIPEAVPA